MMAMGTMMVMMMMMDDGGGHDDYDDDHDDDDDNDDDHDDDAAAKDAKAAKATSRPCRLMLDRAEEHLAGNRPDSIQKCKFSGLRVFCVMLRILGGIASSLSLNKQMWIF